MQSQASFVLGGRKMPLKKMLIPSDIVVGLPFREVKPLRGINRFESYEQSAKGNPLYTAELSTENKLRETKLKIQAHEQKANSWIYRTKFDGWIAGPHELHQLMRWLRII